MASSRSFRHPFSARRAYARASSHSPPPSRDIARHRWLAWRPWTGALVIAALGFTVTGWFVHKERARVLDEGQMTAVRLSWMLDEQTLRTVQAVDLTLLGIVDTIAVTPAMRPHDPAFEEALRRKRAQLPFVRALFVVGADGFITQDTNHPSTPRVNLADRGYFRRHFLDATLGLHIGPPLESRSVGTLFMSLSRRLHTATDDFQGIAVAAVEPRYFERFYERLQLAGGDSIALFHRDGTLYSRVPYAEGRVGQSFAHLPLFQRELSHGPEGVYRATGHMDAVPRIVSYRTVEGLPLVVAVGLAEQPMLAGWQRAALGAFTGTTVMVALATLVLVLLARQARQREETRERLAQAQRLEALGRMTGGIAHDFNNVLNVVATNLDLIRRSADRTPGPVEAATRAVTQGTRLVSQLLAFARRQNLTVEPRDANRLVSTLMPLLRQAAGPSVDIVTNLAGEAWPCLTDDVQLNAALLNLVINARDAMPHGNGKGVVWITTRNCSMAGTRTVGTLPAGDYVQVTVTDNGSGMAADVLQRAVEPFYTTKNAGIGTGLGLSQVYGFMHQVGGGLHIESTLGAGTSVHLFFRRAPQAALDSAEGVPDDRLKAG
jgi:signal transduction histidine kinase